MANYDMSDTACRERAETAERLDKLDQAIQYISDILEEVVNNQNKFEEGIRLLRDMSRLNRDSINAINTRINQ